MSPATSSKRMLNPRFVAGTYDGGEQHLPAGGTTGLKCKKSPWELLCSVMEGRKLKLKAALESSLLS